MTPFDLLPRAQALAPKLTAIRRDLHRHPELGFQEHRTAGIVEAHLRGLGLEPTTGVGRTGVVVDIAGGDGPTVAVRADMDALPIHEDATHDYRSTTDGVMHACGHDAHTAGLLGTAELLVAARDAGRLPGTARLLFQPCEETIDDEGKSGATRMLEDGALEGVSAVTGLHVGGNLPSGKFFVAPGPIMGGGAEIVVEVTGRSAHAALPHEGIDAIVLAAQGILGVQTAVSRRISPMAQGVVSFGHIEGGSAPNVLADHVRLHGTLRYFDEGVRDTLMEVVRGAFEGLRSQGGGALVDFRPGYPPVVNDPAATEVVGQALTAEFGPDAVWPMPPVLLAEDFGFLARAVPGVFFWLGAAPLEPRQHHHPRFDIDESVLPLGATALARAALALLSHVASTSSPSTP
ncbi:MAG: amidohydrolase [Gemmatimonadetes bacterium]|nr:amidohydrolase [Gemmatimonadota bacterium]